MLELEDRGGAKTRVHLKGVEAPAMAALEAQLLGCRAMIQIAQRMRILAALEPADFRRGIGRLARLCREVVRGLARRPMASDDHPEPLRRN